MEDEAARPLGPPSVPVAPWSGRRQAVELLAKRYVQRVARRAGLEVRRRGTSAGAIRVSDELVARIVEKTSGTVSSGPFRGMHLLSEASWGGTQDLVPKLLGVYESELFGAVEDMIARQPSVVVNMGCADGYYAIGVALRLPSALVVGVDIVEESLRLARQASTRNGVSERTEFAVAIERVDGLDLDGSAWIVDIEGAEELLSVPPLRSQLDSSMLIVECHDFANDLVTARLVESFAPTHEIEVIRQGPRDPNAIPLLRDVPEPWRWVAVSEGRPRPMHWLVLRPR